MSESNAASATPESEGPLEIEATGEPRLEHDDAVLRGGDEVALAWRAVKYAVAANPRWNVAMLLLAVPPALVPAATLAATARAVTAAADLAAAKPGASGELTSALVFMVAAMATQGLVSPISQFAVGEAARAARLRARHDVVRTLANLRSLAPWDDKTLPDDASRADEAIGSLNQTVRTARQFMIVLLELAPALAIFVRVGWWAPVLVFASSLAAVTVSVRAARRRRVTELELVEQRRRSDYFFELAFQEAAAKEVRVFGLGHWIAGRFGDVYGRYARRILGVALRNARDESVAEVARVAALAVVAVVAVRAAARGELPIGDPAAVLGAIFIVQRNAQFLGQIRARLVLSTEHLPALWRIHDAAATDRDSLPDGTAEVPRPMLDGIRFENVHFAYPRGTTSSAPRDILDGLDLHVPAGTSLAIVGVNGAGKSTLVKLLSRGYDPTEGRITVDGIDLRSLDLRKWRDRLGVVFQDFVHLPLTAADNVSLRPLPTEELDRAADAAGATPIVERLEKGWATLMARDLGGTDLSGGEWQRIALARCAARRDADVLVLDEPTAALDVRTEADVVAQFRELSLGRTTLLISHRLSTVRVADRIAVIDRGRVAELGTHAELLARDGIYAQLWAMQTAHLETDEAGAATGAPA